MGKLPEQLDNLDDPFLNIGERLENEIIDNFSGIVSPRKIARQLALKYALYLREYDLHTTFGAVGKTIDAGTYQYSLWTRAISESRNGNWESLRLRIEKKGMYFLNDPADYYEDKELGISLINLSRVL